MKHTTIDQTICIGCGTCVSLCPNYYRMNEDDTKAIIREDHTEQETSLLEETRQACPVGAISWKDDQSPSS